MPIPSLLLRFPDLVATRPAPPPIRTPTPAPPSPPIIAPRSSIPPPSSSPLRRQWSSTPIPVPAPIPPHPTPSFLTRSGAIPCRPGSRHIHCHGEEVALQEPVLVERLLLHHPPSPPLRQGPIHRCVTIPPSIAVWRGDGGHEVAAGEGDEFLGLVQAVFGRIDVHVLEAVARDGGAVGRGEDGVELLHEGCWCGRFPAVSGILEWKAGKEGKEGKEGKKGKATGHGGKMRGRREGRRRTSRRRGTRPGEEAGYRQSRAEKCACPSSRRRG